MAVATRRIRCAGAAVLIAWCGLASVARADLPAGVDRVPADAVGLIAIRNLSSFHESMAKYAELLQLQDEDSPVAHMEQLLQTPGLSKEGSAIVVVLPGGAGEEDFGKYTVMLAPVTDAKVFAESLQAQGTGVMKAQLMDEQVFMKDVGNGYVVMGPDESVVGSFKATEGSAAKFKQMMGATATRTADTADVIVYLTMPLVTPSMERGASRMKDAQNMAAGVPGGAGGAQIEAASKAAQAIGANLEKDGQAVVLAFSADDAGISFDVVSQFKEGSPSAQMLQIKGGSAPIAGALPDSGFLFAWAVDTSSPITKSFIKEMTSKMGDGGEGEAPSPWSAMLTAMENVDGMGMVIGLPPGGVMGGLLTATTQYVKTADPQGYITAIKGAMETMNGLQVGQGKVTTTYKTAAVEAGGQKVDSWQMVIPVDFNDPNAQMMQQAQMMMYGMGPGPSGLIAPAGDGVVFTMGSSPALIAAGMQSAKSGKGLTSQEMFAPVLGKLPRDRAIEGYISIKGLIDMVGPFAAQFAGAPITSPEKLSPVALAGTMDGGAMGLRLIVPRDVIETVAGIISEMQEMNGGDDEPEGDAPAGQSRPPRF